MDFPAWDPVLFDIPGLPIDIRWYGLMYVVGFLAGQAILTRLARAGFFPVAPERVGDLIFYTVIGVLLGGRIGYSVFYDQALLSPLKFLQVWGGGLSFHGGLVGVCVAFWLFARKHKLPALRVGDACALAVTPGIFAVRIANFVNGELYGRVTEAGTGWAMRFPTDPVAQRLLGIQEGWTMRDRELCVQVAYGHRTFADVQPLLSKTDALGRPIPWDSIAKGLDWNAVKDQVPFRHPSQIYEALGEGLVLGLLLFLLYATTRKRPYGPGFYGGLFLVGYAAARFPIEFLRQPDAQFTGPDDPVGTVLLGLTMGQTLCVAMALAGLAFAWHGRNRLPAPPVPGGLRAT